MRQVCKFNIYNPTGDYKVAEGVVKLKRPFHLTRTNIKSVVILFKKKTD